MRAARWHARGDVRVEDVPEPAPSAGEAVVAVAWCGICGTDLEEYLDGPVGIPVDAPHPLSGRRAPIVLGHEVVGTIVQPAADGSGPPAGARVVPDVVVGCGSCWWCRRHQEGLCERLAVRGLQADGGLAERMAATASTCVQVPDELPLDHAALAEPTAVAVRAVRKLPAPVGARALVLGAGTVGLLVAQVLRRAGARHVAVVDPDPRRLDLARALGVDETGAPGELDGIWADAVVECAGAPGLAAEAVRRTRAGGTTVLVGFHPGPAAVDLVDLVLGEKHVVGSAAHLWDEDVAVAVDLLARGHVDVRPLITHRIELADVVAGGLTRLADRDDGALKILVTPGAAHA